jgi:hypothetical protein
MVPTIMNPSRFAGAAAGWDWDDDFTSYANNSAFDVVYPTANTTYHQGNASLDRIDYTVPANTTVKSLHRDWGSSISDTAWICRFRWNITVKTLDPTGWNNDQSIGFSSADNTVAEHTSQDGISLCAYQDNLVRYYFAAWADASSFNGDIGSGNNGSAFATVPTVGDNYYIQEVRDSATAMTVGLYSDEYSTLTEAENPTDVPNTTTGLRYWSMKGFSAAADPDGNQEGNVNTYLKFRNGATTPP